MRQSLIWAAAVYLTASTTVFADPITTIPLFRRHNNDGFVKADAEQLDNGVVRIPLPIQHTHLNERRCHGYQFISFFTPSYS